MNCDLRNTKAAILLLFILFAASCKKKSDSTVMPAATSGALTVRVSNMVDGQPITLGQMVYTNAAGNLYRADVLKYYISNFTLIKDDNTEVNFANHKLINASDTSTCHFTDSLVNGKYTSVKFYLGVDSAHNHTGLQQGDLDPVYGMAWDWNTGYIFFKHEGAYRNDTGGNTILMYHLGTDPAYATITLPVTAFEVKGDAHVLYLNFDLNKVYAAPGTINFAGNNVHQSLLSTDRSWIVTMKSNLSSAFSFDKVQ